MLPNSAQSLRPAPGVTEWSRTNTPRTSNAGPTIRRSPAVSPPGSPNFVPRVDHARHVGSRLRPHDRSGWRSDRRLEGWVDEPGDIAHWPGGLVLAFPAAGTVNGTVVLAPGDVNLTFKEYIREPIRLTVIDDHVTTIDGDGLDADLRSYIAAFNEPEASRAISHVGWGMNPASAGNRWRCGTRLDTNGTELRAFAGNFFLFSTGPTRSPAVSARATSIYRCGTAPVTLDATAVVTEVDSATISHEWHGEGNHDRLRPLPRTLARSPRDRPRQVPACPNRRQGTGHCVTTMALGYDRSLIGAWRLPS